MDLAIQKTIPVSEGQSQQWLHRDGKRTLIVCDWNIIETIGGNTDFPPCYEFVLADQALHEVANKEPCEQQKCIGVLRGWLSRHLDRFWAGHTVEALFEREYESGQRLSLNDLIDHRHTEELRSRVRLANYDWQQLFASAAQSASVQNRNANIQQYVQICKAVTTSWKDHEKGPPSKQAQVQQIRQPGLVTDLIEAYFGQRWRPEWREVAAKQTNQFALERWVRLVVWYCLKLADNHTNKFENNFDDIHYALLASYVGHLATNDKGLQRATEAIFPDVQIITEADLKKS